MDKIDYSNVHGKYVLFHTNIEFLPNINNYLIFPTYDIYHRFTGYHTNGAIKGWQGLNKLLKAGARVAVCATHFPELNPAIKGPFTFKYFAEDKNYKFVSDCLDKSFMPQMRNGSFVLLENIWFNHAEQDSKNDKAFAEQLAQGYDMFVYDEVLNTKCKLGGFASVQGVQNILPSYAGYDLEQTSKALADIAQDIMEYRKNHRRPYYPQPKTRSEFDFICIAALMALNVAGVAPAQLKVAEPEAKKVAVYIEKQPLLNCVDLQKTMGC